MPFEAGQECEMRCSYEGVESWPHVRIVSDDGKAVWVKYADGIGNSFPVPRELLRDLDEAAE